VRDEEGAVVEDKLRPDGNPRVEFEFLRGTGFQIVEHWLNDCILVAQSNEPLPTLGQTGRALLDPVVTEPMYLSSIYRQDTGAIDA